MRVHQNRKEIIEAIQHGHTYQHIQDTYQCSWIMITYWKRKLGMPIKKTDKSPETDKNISRLLKAGKTQLQIIKELGTHSQRIMKVKNGLVYKKKGSKVGEFGGWY